MIKVMIKTDSRYPVDRARVRKVVQKFLEEEMNVEVSMQVSVLFVGDRKMKELNRKYLDRDVTTDVLSFSQLEMGGDDEFIEEAGGDGVNIGDVVVSYPQAVRQAIERQHVVDEEIDFLVKHGLLHLMGIHHD